MQLAMRPRLRTTSLNFLVLIYNMLNPGQSPHRHTQTGQQTCARLVRNPWHLCMPLCCTRRHLKPQLFSARCLPRLHNLLLARPFQTIVLARMLRETRRVNKLKTKKTTWSKQAAFSLSPQPTRHVKYASYVIRTSAKRQPRCAYDFLLRPCSMNHCLCRIVSFLWLWVKSRYPEWNPRWTHPPKPAVPWRRHFDPSPCWVQNHSWTPARQACKACPKQ